MPAYLVYVYFVYGLAFFSMGLGLWFEGGRASEARLRLALRWLMAFGLAHGLHEWVEMFQGLGLLPGVGAQGWEAARLAMLAVSFVLLAAFGGALLAASPAGRHQLLLSLTLVWGLGAGALALVPEYAAERWAVLNVWTRYTLAIPAALLASAGLVGQQRAFRRAGLAGFGRDSLWAAVAFGWYGLVGQAFGPVSPLPPSTVLNQAAFAEWFGFPVQLLRAGAAVVAAVFVIRFVRAFEVEAQRQLADLQGERLREAERRQVWRGELLRRVVAAQEAERQRVARDLHDATGQALTALGLGLRSAAVDLPAGAGASAQALHHLERLAAQSLDELRRLIADLRPSHLDDLGLGAALRWYAQELMGRAPLKIQVQVLGPEQPLTPPVRLALFRIAQEALTNTLKHSGAGQVEVRLAYAAEAVHLSVQDDGQGLPPGGPSHPAWGLLGMEERATLLGGECRVRSAPGRGVTVEVRIPLTAGAL